MIRIIRRLNEDGKIETLKKPLPNCWIDVENPNEKEISFIEKKLKVPRDYIVDCLDEDEIPRISSENGIVVIILRIPVESEKDIFTIPLGIILTRNSIITIHSHRVEFLSQFFRGEIKFSTSKRIRLIFQILMVLIHKFTRLLRSLEKEIRKIEKEFLKSAKNEDILLLMRIKENVLDLQNAIYENNKVLEAILTGHHIKLYKGDIKIINDILIDNKQCITMSSFLIKNVNNALQTFEWIISNNLNMLMKKLTSLAVILSMPLIVSGIYGMNIRLPLQYSENAFIILIVISLILSLIVAIYFKSKDWI